MNDVKRFSLVKPTIDTPFYIDFDWWKEHDNNWRIFLFSYLCAKHQSSFSNQEESAIVDWVDPETAEVKAVDGLLHTLINHCARQPEFLTSNTAMVDSVFRILLSKGNNAMTPVELGLMLNRPADTILRTFSGATVYKGIRPKQK